MRKRTLSLLLAGLLTLSLTACGGGDVPTPSSQTVESPSAEETVTPSPSEESTQPSESQPSETQPSETQPSEELPMSAGMSLPDRDYQPWQRGYLDLLTQLRVEELDIETAWAALDAAEREADEALTDELIHHVSDSYCLYDVDKDGVPELLVTFGNADAVHSTRCYTFRDGEIVLAGEFSSEYCYLYTYPDKNGFLLGSMGLGGHSEVTAYSLEDGRLSEGQQLLSEDNAEQLTYADDLVPGAVMLDSYPTRVGGSMSAYYGRNQSAQPMTALLLPVCDWYDGPPATGSDPEQARAAILAVMEDGAPFIGVCSAGFGSVPAGPTDLAEFAACQYMSEGALPYELAGYFWQDLNRDGQEECLLQLSSTYEDGSWCGNAFLVLSEQDGVVYGYDPTIASLCNPYTDGTIRHNSICVALAFWKEQCYMYYPTAHEMPNENYISYDEAARSAEWIQVAQVEG